MDFSAAHAGFVLAAYALSAAVLLAMIIGVVRRDRALRRKADEEAARHGQ